MQRQILDSCGTTHQFYREQGSSGGDCTSVASANRGTSPGRLKAEGFPLAPLIEAVLAVEFTGGMLDNEAAEIAKLLNEHYPRTSQTSHRDLSMGPDGSAIEVKDPRPAYRLEGKDETELALLRSDSLAVSQLAPYKSWEILFERFERDFGKARQVITRPLARIGCRYINRIDVPFDGHIAHYEDYFAAHIKLPEEIEAINGFEMRFSLDVSEIDGSAVVQSTVMQPAVDGCASFSLDIQVLRAKNIPEEDREALDLFAAFRAAKNRLYRIFLTNKALEPFK